MPTTEGPAEALAPEDPKRSTVKHHRDFSVVAAPGGEIRVVSVASEGEVKADALDDVQSGFDRLGTIALGAVGQLDASGERGGRVVVRGKALHLVGSSALIRANTYGTGDGLGVNVAVDDLLISGQRSGIFSSSAPTLTRVDPDSIELGDAGPITLRVASLEIRDAGRVVSDNSGAGSGGQVDS